MTFKDVQTALKALKIKKTIQEISDFFAQHNLGLDTISLDLVVELFVKAQNQPKEKQNIPKKFNKNNQFSGTNFTVLGEYHAIEMENLCFVVFVDYPKLTKISIHDYFEEAEKMAKNLNMLYRQ